MNSSTSHLCEIHFRKYCISMINRKNKSVGQYAVDFTNNKVSKLFHGALFTFSKIQRQGQLPGSSEECAFQLPWQRVANNKAAVERSVCIFAVFVFACAWNCAAMRVRCLCAQACLQCGRVCLRQWQDPSQEIILRIVLISQTDQGLQSASSGGEVSLD